jgi:hypothetical protein
MTASKLQQVLDNQILPGFHLDQGGQWLKSSKQSSYQSKNAQGVKNKR